jgi:hypothetical protein
MDGFKVKIMKHFIPTLCIIILAFTLRAYADEGDDTLKFYLSESDCVALGTISSESIGISTDAGVVEYVCDFTILEKIKGDALTNGITTRVTIVQNEGRDSSVRNPLIKKGGECILFLKTSANSLPKLRTADRWLGIQYSSGSMASYLKRVSQEP